MRCTKNQETTLQATGNAILEMRGVTLAFGGVKALDKVTFRVAEGSITSVIGPDGAGKTSVSNTIPRVYTPSAGTIAFRGQGLAGVPPPGRTRPMQQKSQRCIVESGASLTSLTRTSQTGNQW